MKWRRLKLLIFALGPVALLTVQAPGISATRAAEAVYESVYNYIIVSREGDIVRFRRMENGATVSAIDLANPRRQVITYTGLLFAGALIKPDPKNVLNIGLGAGAFNRLFEPTFPNANLTTAEIDPMILKIASSLAAFRESASDKVMLEDGRRFVAHSSETWDWIVLDAFVRNSQVPFHLTTVEFYKLLSEHMSSDGVVVSNLHSGSLLYFSNIRTLRKSFAQVALVKLPSTGNVIAIAVKFDRPNLMELLSGIDVTRLPNLTAWGVDFTTIQKFTSDAAATQLPDDAPLLSDDFAPAEYLDLKQR